MFDRRITTPLILILVPLLLMIGCSDSQDEPVTHLFPTPTPELALVADASNGIQQFVGGQTIPVGEYFFQCDTGGNVSIQSATPPYSVSMESGDQIKEVNQGDLVTVGWCKTWQDIPGCLKFTEEFDFEIALMGAAFELKPDLDRGVRDTFRMTKGVDYTMQMDFVTEGPPEKAKTYTAHGVMDGETCAMYSLLIE